MTVGDSVLKLVERNDIHAPIQLGLIRGGKTFIVRYLLWDKVPFKAEVFARPTAVKIQEVKKLTIGGAGQVLISHLPRRLARREKPVAENGVTIAKGRY